MPIGIPIHFYIPLDFYKKVPGDTEYLLTNSNTVPNHLLNHFGNCKGVLHTTVLGFRLTTDLTPIYSVQLDPLELGKETTAMVETSVLAELMFEVLPVWCEKLQKYIRETDKPTTGIAIMPSGSGVTEDNTPQMLATGVNCVAASGECPSLIQGEATEHVHSIPQLNKSLATPHNICRLDAKPPGSKTRFSSLTGPLVMYDGESQNMLFELWTSLNNKRGGLRREMMAAKRRQELAPPRMVPSIEAESETEGNSSTGKEEEDDLEHSSEMLRLRLKIEREKLKRTNRRAGDVGGAPVGVTPLKALPFKCARPMTGPPVSTADGIAGTPSGTDDLRLKTLLEAIDGNLDKACKVTEMVAYVWLKGDVYEGHLKFIVGRLKDTITTIGASGFVPPKTEEAASSAPVTTDADSAVPPPPASSAHPELSRKKSGTTIGGTCVVSLTTSPGGAGQALLTCTTPASIEVGSLKDEITPAILVNMLASSKAREESHKSSEVNPLDREG